MRALRPDEIDADTDGFSAALDCDDSNPTIRPGALEIPGNAVDENCDQRREPFPKLTTNATISAFFGKKFSLMERLRITGLDGGETVKISCKGRGCRKSIRGSVRVRRKVAVLKLDKRVRGARLRKGARLEVRISKPGFVTRVTRFTIRLGDIAKRTELCQVPGARRPPDAEPPRATERRPAALRGPRGASWGRPEPARSGRCRPPRLDRAWPGPGDTGMFGARCAG